MMQDRVCHSIMSKLQQIALDTRVLLMLASCTFVTGSNEDKAFLMSNRAQKPQVEPLPSMQHSMNQQWMQPFDLSVG